MHRETEQDNVENKKSAAGRGKAEQQARLGSSLLQCSANDEAEKAASGQRQQVRAKHAVRGRNEGH